ncbi:SixA phosphatase family protein [Ferruginibacter yonginensis]|uniref:SixA phosphatase family protein n=1 Tax=Ferruginibacter yonginensis TaxID=1310416 RepID=A0ABV8QSJ5_9BACT
MKKIIIVRHAKSSWLLTNASDFDRPLNERGKNDAPLMAAKLQAAQIHVDALITSTALRAKTTCEIFASTLGIAAEQIQYKDVLYHAPAEVFFEVINGLDDTYGTVAIFAHNPGITEFVNSLCNDVFVDNMPTCGMFAVAADITSWSAFENATKKLLFFKYPKEA